MVAGLAGCKRISDFKSLVDVDEFSCASDNPRAETGFAVTFLLSEFSSGVSIDYKFIFNLRIKSLSLGNHVSLLISCSCSRLFEAQTYLFVPSRQERLQDQVL